MYPRAKPRYTNYQSGFINMKSILRFYQLIAFPDFMDITDERKVELDELVKKWECYFKEKAKGTLALITILSEKLTVSAKRLGVSTNSEKAYFFIQMFDPKLKHLVAHETTNNTQDHINQLGFLDNNLIALEKAFNFRFKQYDLEELWTQDDVLKKL